jgi:predicted GNAT family N-acyltransferase
MTGINKQIFVVQRIKKYNIWSLIKYLWIRNKVFVGEYKKPIIKEFDTLDIIAEHYIALISNRKIVGTARVLYKADVALIGRVAVLSEYRNKGYGAKLINQIVANIKNSNKANLISLFTDDDKIDFYKKFGFVENGKAFFDNIPYAHMIAYINS